MAELLLMKPSWNKSGLTETIKHLRVERADQSETQKVEQKVEHGQIQDYLPMARPPFGALFKNLQ